MALVEIVGGLASWRLGGGIGGLSSGITTQPRRLAIARMFINRVGPGKQLGDSLAVATIPVLAKLDELPS